MIAAAEKCPDCLGHRWVVVAKRMRDGREIGEVRACETCNPEGKLPIGVVVDEDGS